MSHGFQVNSGMDPYMHSEMHFKMHFKMHLRILKCILNAFGRSKMHFKCIRQKYCLAKGCLLKRTVWVPHGFLSEYLGDNPETKVSQRTA